MSVHRLVAIGCVSALIATTPAVSAAQQLEWLPFEVIDQSALPIVRAKLNGSGSHRLVLDAGFTDFVLDMTIVEGSGMKIIKQGEVAEIDYYGRKERVEVGYVQSLELGEAKFMTVRTLLVEGEDGTGIGGIRSYGRIGRDLLEPLRITVHYPRRLYAIELSPEEDVPAGGVTYDSAGRFLLVPVQIHRDEAASHDVHFVMDAGTSNTVIDRDFAEKQGLASKDDRMAKLEELRIGDFVASGVTALIGVMKELPYDGQPVGVVGADLLLNASITYDFARDRVWIVRVDDAGAGGTASP